MTERGSHLVNRIGTGTEAGCVGSIACARALLPSLLRAQPPSVTAAHEMASWTSASLQAPRCGAMAMRWPHGSALPCGHLAVVLAEAAAAAAAALHVLELT
jgi:hypothetical protein